MLSQQASDIVVMEEGKAVAHGTHLLPPHHHRFVQLNLLWKTGPLSQLKSQPGFVASLLDRIEQNQGAAAAGQSRGPGTLLSASPSCSSLSSPLFPPWPSPSCAAVSVESALFALEEACGSDAGVQGAEAVVLGLGLMLLWSSSLCVVMAVALPPFCCSNTPPLIPVLGHIASLRAYMSKRQQNSNIAAFDFDLALA